MPVVIQPIAQDFSHSGAAVYTDEVTVNPSLARCMVVAVMGEEASVTRITFNGDDLTFLDRQAGASSFCELWFRVAPDVGRFDLVTTLDATDVCVVAVTVGQGVAPSAPLRPAVKATGTGTSSSIDLATVKQYDHMVDALSIDAAGTEHVPVDGSQQFTLWNRSVGVSDVHGAGSGQIGEHGGVMSWTWADSQDFSHVATAFIALAPVREHITTFEFDAAFDARLITLPANCEVLEVVVVTAVGGMPQTYLTFNERGMVRLSEVTHTDGHPQASLWYQVAPPSDEHMLTVTNIIMDKTVVVVNSWSDIDLTTPLTKVDPEAAQGTSANPSNTAGGPPNAKLADAVVALDLGVPVPGAGQTEVWSVASLDCRVAGSVENGPGPRIMDWTCVSSAWGIITFGANVTLRGDDGQLVSKRPNYSRFPRRKLRSAA